jgi:hypothetical protein
MSHVRFRASLVPGITCAWISRPATVFAVVAVTNAFLPALRRTDLAPRAAASDGDPAEAAAGAVRLALLPDDGPTGGFFSWDGTPAPW